MTTDSITDSRADAKSLYRTIWRWHFYAGVFCIPFVIILALTGAIYLFKPYYENWQESQYHKLTANQEALTPNQQIVAALEEFPAAKLLSYRLPQSANEAVLINVQTDQVWQVFVNPYTGEVLGKQASDDKLMNIVKTIHGELLIGNVGSVLVELAACWAIVLMVTGLYLWWPRNAKGFAGVLYPRLRQGSRTFWRDLHAVVGIWISAFALFLLVSGLPWALVWGASLKEVRNFSAAAAQPVREPTAPIASPTTPPTTAQQDWTQGRHEEHRHLGAQASASFDLTPEILNAAIELQFVPPIELSVANADTGQWKLSSQTPNRPLRTDAWINAKGLVESRSDFANKKTLDRIIGIGIAAHEGYLFGWFNLVLGVLTCAGLILMSVSGFILWRKRKPQSTLGAPAARPTKVGIVVVAITFGLALCLPLMAISLIVILSLEFALLRRLNITRQWLGLPD